MLEVKPCEDYETITGQLQIRPGVHPLYFAYEGEGSWQLKEFELY